MNSSSSGCSGNRSVSAITRRQALQLGAVGGLGLTLPSILRAESEAARTAKSAKAKSVILLWIQGGVSHHDSFDPKPDAPAEVRGEFGTIATKLPGVLFADQVPLLAGMLDQFALIRSVTHKESAHERGSMYMVEGRRPPRDTGVSHSGNPMLGSIIAHQLGARAGVPAFVSNPGNDFTTGFTGQGWLSRSTRPFRGVDVGVLKSGEKAGADYLEQRKQLLTQLDMSRADSKAHSWDRFQAQAVDLLTSGKTAAAFDLSKESDATKKLYGIGLKGDRLGEFTLTARRLVEAGVRFVTIGRDSWDHHDKIFPQLKGRLPGLDAAFSGLLTDLKQRSMFNDTLVVYLTEYGRTPKINDKAGRDHWPQAFSVALAGAGIKPGQVIGASDRIGAEVKDSPVSPEQIAATILHLVGIDPQTIVNRIDGRPTTVAEEGDPLKQLLS
ncbi:MAG: DUF1501 domain-containing protein [Planctomycetaceae bacterium]|nr:DUF1501 domain-containing protein [Planctomycetaceae bacterium]